jgi:hypothetical protein
LVYFVDAKARTTDYLEDNLDYGKTCHILSTSPRRAIVNEFKKKSPSQVFFMPIWAETEMASIARLYPGSTDWKVRFDVLGGVPRDVFDVVIKQCAEPMIEDACSNYLN